MSPRPLIVACGALARELRAVLSASGLTDAIEVTYLPAHLHNRPDQIVPGLRPFVQAAVDQDRPVFVGYSDCGTGGLLDAMLADFPGVARLPGAHCYEMFAGESRFANMHDAAPGTMYLTDYLALHFDALVWTGLGLDRHPQLRDTYFGNYTRVMFLAQSDDDVALACARSAAEQLGLAFEYAQVGRTGIEEAVGLFATLAVSGA